MFDKDRYITKGVRENISPLHYIFLWQLVDEMNVAEKDYLQIFELRKKHLKSNTMEIVHRQEQPLYSKKYLFKTSIPVNAKIYVIDDGEHSTMLLAEEY